MCLDGSTLVLTMGNEWPLAPYFVDVVIRYNGEESYPEKMLKALNGSGKGDWDLSACKGLKI